MDDEHTRYPALSRRQVALFERNPVCALCYDICRKWRKEYGLVNFKIINGLEEADSLCEQIINHPWELDGVEQYYHRLESRLDSNDLSISCAIAILCVTFNCMENLPEPIRQLSYNFEALLVGQGIELFESLMTAACNKSIILNISTYGNPPPAPPMIIENQQLRAQQAALKQQIANYQNQLRTMLPNQNIQINGDVNNGPVTNINGPVYLAPVSQYFYQQHPAPSGAPCDSEEKDLSSNSSKSNSDIPLFRFIHPSVTDEAERLQIHREVVNIVTHLPLPEVCRCLRQMKHDNRVFLCSKPETMFEELHRLGLPPESTAGFTKKNFMNYYNIND